MAHVTCHPRVTRISLTGPNCQHDGFLLSLDITVDRLRSQVYALSTQTTYRSQWKSCLHFCDLAGLQPVPLSQNNARRYIAFLSGKCSYTSIKAYINVVRIMHLEAGFKNPFANSWAVDTLLKGAKRVLGTATRQTLAITPSLLFSIFSLIFFSSPFDTTFWAACLVDFVPSGRMLSGRTHISPCQLGEYQEDECQLDEDRLDELIIIPK